MPRARAGTPRAGPEIMRIRAINLPTDPPRPKLPEQWPAPPPLPDPRVPVPPMPEPMPAPLPDIVPPEDPIEP